MIIIITALLTLILANGLATYVNYVIMVRLQVYTSHGDQVRLGKVQGVYWVEIVDLEKAYGHITLKLPLFVHQEQTVLRQQRSAPRLFISSRQNSKSGFT